MLKSPSQWRRRSVKQPESLWRAFHYWALLLGIIIKYFCWVFFRSHRSSVLLRQRRFIVTLKLIVAIPSSYAATSTTIHCPTPVMSLQTTWPTALCQQETVWACHSIVTTCISALTTFYVQKISPLIGVKLTQNWTQVTIILSFVG